MGNKKSMYVYPNGNLIRFYEWPKCIIYARTRVSTRAPYIHLIVQKCDKLGGKSVKFRQIKIFHNFVLKSNVKV